MEFNNKQWKYLALFTPTSSWYMRNTLEYIMGRWTVGSADLSKKRNFQRVRWKLLACHRPQKTRPLKNHPTCSSCSTTICYRNSGLQKSHDSVTLRFYIKDSGHHYSPTISWCLQPRFRLPRFVSLPTPIDSGRFPTCVLRRTRYLPSTSQRPTS